MTNFEKIKSLGLEEMAKAIFDCGNGREYCYGHCYFQNDDTCPNDGGQGCLQGVIKWLESEANNDLL